MINLINVVAGIIEKEGKFLIAKRKKWKHLENKWEFPGGKIELGGIAENRLKRELEEEFGINTKIGGFITESSFDYGDRRVNLAAYRVKYLEGEFELRDHDEIRWVSKSEFGGFDFAEANLPIIQKIIN